MSSILYYSKYCEVSKKYLQTLSKSNVQKDIHFICIDKRLKENGKTYIVLETGQKILLPENVAKVPALLLLNNNQILYGDNIYNYFKSKQEVVTKQVTQNNMEPMAFSFGGGFSDIVSDQYSFLDQAPEDLEAKGNGGMRQMHNYVDLNTAFNGEIQQYGGEDTNTTIRGVQKIGEDASNQVMEDRIRKMKEERDADIRTLTGNRPPSTF